MFTPSKTNIDNNKNEIHKDRTVGYIFNGAKITEKNGNANFIFINMLSEFNHASVEELHLADYELRDEGNITKYKINDTSLKISKIKNLDKNIFLNPDLFRYISSIKIEKGEEKQEGLFGNINNSNNNRANSSFENIKNISKNPSNSIFGNINNTNTNTNSLFENNNTNETGVLFGNNIFNHKATNTTGELFGNNKTNTAEGLFDHKSTNIIGGSFGNNNTNTIGGHLYGSQNKKIRRNINIPNEAIKKCDHEKDFVCYCPVNSKNKGGLLCYECLYKYHKEHIFECFLIKKIILKIINININNI